MTRPNPRLGKLRKTMDETMAAVREPGTRIPRLYRRWECVNVGTGIAPVRSRVNAIRGLYRRWGIAPRPEDKSKITHFGTIVNRFFRKKTLFVPAVASTGRVAKGCLEFVAFPIAFFDHVW